MLGGRDGRQHGGGDQCHDEGQRVEGIDEGQPNAEEDTRKGRSYNRADLDDDLHHCEGRCQVATLDHAGDRCHAGGVGEAHAPRRECTDDVEHDQGRVRRRSIDGHGTAGEDQCDCGPHHDAATVDGIADRTRPQRSGDERDELRQADGTNLQRRPGHRIDLEGDGDDGQLIPEHGDQLAGEEQTEVAALPQRGGVHEDPTRHGSSLRLPLPAESPLWARQESC